MLAYQELLQARYKKDPSKIPHRLLCLDPGETTGWAVFVDGFLTDWGQSPTVILSTDKGANQGEKILNWPILYSLFADTNPKQVICEDYKVYAHKLDQHTYSSVYTLRLIGGIDMLCALGWGSYPIPVPISYQMAAQHKGFVTDEKLKEWDMWRPGMKHSRDAIRAGIYFLLFTNIKQSRLNTEIVASNLINQTGGI